MAVSEEMVLDFQNLIASLTPKEFGRMIERSLQAANATSLQIVREVVKSEDGEGYEQQYVMKFCYPADTEYFLQPDEKKTHE